MYWNSNSKIYDGMDKADVLVRDFSAPIIYNHAHPPLPHPLYSKGDSHGNERGFDQSYATAVQGKYPGFVLYRQKGL